MRLLIRRLLNVEGCACEVGAYLFCIRLKITVSASRLSGCRFVINELFLVLDEHDILQLDPQIQLYYSFMF